jgi:hypothetical protein
MMNDVKKGTVMEIEFVKEGTDELLATHLAPKQSLNKT